MRLLRGLLVCLAVSRALAVEPAPRALSFEARVRAQAAIERVYFSHQLGTTKRFEDAMPAAVLEAKVRKYLELSAALNVYWKTAVTDEALEREAARMATATRMPGRLAELYAALGNDPVTIKECLARATLVDRLSRSFYAFDGTLHAGSRAQAERLHAQLVAGNLSPYVDHPNRKVGEVVVVRTGAQPAPNAKPSQQQLSPEEFRKRRAELPARPGLASQIEESRDAFAFDVILSETPTSLRIASYLIPKVTWDVWWDRAHRALQLEQVPAVATPRGPLMQPLEGSSRASASASGLPCMEDDGWENGSMGGLPEARADHSAVWTGSVMLVWGGTGSSRVLNTGGRYDPATDSWTLTSTADAPSARTGHVAVWARGVMVVWGGFGDTGEMLNTGARYDPATDTWLRMDTKDAPEARVSPVAVWTGRVMVVWGGRGGSPSHRLNTGGRYDPETDEWTPTSMRDVPSADHDHKGVWTGSLLVVWGGYASEEMSTGGRYDPVSDSWKVMSKDDAPELRGGYSLVWAGNVMVAWGDSNSNVGGRYDPLNDEWTPTSTTGAPSRRAEHTALWTGSQMLVWGGHDDRGRGRSTGGSYDPRLDTWTAMSGDSTPSARERHTAVWTGSLMLVWGGYGNYGTNGEPGIRFNTGARYDPVSDRWTPTSTAGAPPAQEKSSAVWTGNLLLVWGGRVPDRQPQDLSSGGRYDPATDSWTPTATTGAPRAREQHTAVWTGAHMVIWGGSAGDEAILDTGGRYDPAIDRWTPTSTAGAPSARVGHTAVWTGNQMVVWGGYRYPDFFNTGGRYNPVSDSWTPTSTNGAPPARDAHASVWTGSLMLIWGGESDAADLGGGGRYNPATDSWTPISTVASPGAFTGQTAVWTGTQMVVWGGPTEDGGRYSPLTNRWASTSTIDAPSERSHHTALWTGNVMVVWGGESGIFGNRLDTGGRYDPVADRWTPTSTSRAPAARSRHAAVWTGSAMLVWGGDSLMDVDGVGRYVLGSSIDNDGDGYSECQGDCNDANATRHPGAKENCNGVDDDCDGIVDDGGDSLCDDGNACTIDSCRAAAGKCVNSAKPNGTVCDDANSCTSGDTCQAGTCTPVFSALQRPSPRNADYYRNLCEARTRNRPPYVGDPLTVADALCVGEKTATFAGITTVDALCSAIVGRPRPPLAGGPAASSCDGGDSELVVAALNICRARICEDQKLVSRCHGGARTTVAQSFADADAILDDGARTRNSCASAMCELREINNPVVGTGRARR